MISHTTYFGDGTYTFTLTDTVIEELQHKTGVGIGSLFLRLSTSQFRASDLPEVIRLALVGGGTAPQDAQRLVDAYAKDRPFDETLPLALDILDARWNGKPDSGQPTSLAHDAAASGDMAAAINESLKESGL